MMSRFVTLPVYFCGDGRPRQTWLRTIEKDPQEQNLGLWTAWFYAQDRVR